MATYPISKERLILYVKRYRHHFTPVDAIEKYFRSYFALNKKKKKLYDSFQKTLPNKLVWLLLLYKFFISLNVTIEMLKHTFRK